MEKISNFIIGSVITFIIAFFIITLFWPTDQYEYYCLECGHGVVWLDREAEYKHCVKCGSENVTNKKLQCVYKCEECEFEIKMAMNEDVTLQKCPKCGNNIIKEIKIKGD